MTDKGNQRHLYVVQCMATDVYESGASSVPDLTPGLAKPLSKIQR